MPDDFENENEELEIQEETKNPGREYQRDLEKKNRRLQDEAETARAQIAEATAIKRENAFLKAGIATESGVGKLFFKSYEGELTPEAIKRAAEEDGLDLIPTSQRSDVSQELDDLRSTSRVSQSSAGSTAPDEISQIRQARTPQEVIALAQKAGSSISNEQPWGMSRL